MSAQVLIVDDDARNIFALSATLRAKGVQCVTASGAWQGLSIMRAEPTVRLVLLDMMMPEMDGYEALPKFKEQFEVPVIAVTAQAMVGDREKCLAAGADDYISKPIDVEKLMDVVTRFLNMP